MIHEIVAVQPTTGTRLILSFAGGERREIDIADVVPFDGVFQHLNDPSYFRQVRVHPEFHTIVWPNGADLCPDVLYEASRRLLDSEPSVAGSEP